MALRLFFLLCLLAPSVDFQRASARTAGRNLGVYRPAGPSSGSSSPDVIPTPDTSSPTYTTTPRASSSSSSPSSSGGSSPYPTTPSGSSSSPVVERPPGTSPYSSTGGPSSGSSPATPDVNVGSPLSSPVVDSPLSSPVVGSPLATPESPDTSNTPTTPSYGGGKGSCGFWSHHSVKFPSILSRLSSLGSIFGGKAPSIFGMKMTLMEALVNPNQDEFSSLARQGTASLLNAYVFPNSFPFTPTQVRENFSLGLENPLAARQQAALFERANNMLP